MNANCERCLKPQRLCVCEFLPQIETSTRVLILQHPQEPDVELGTAKIAALSLVQAKLAIGLSWPNLKKAWGAEVNPKDWLVLHLGSIRLPQNISDVLVCVSAKGHPLEDSKKRLSACTGLVVLDGTWSQAKTLWWRNAWLTKLQRAVLNPSRPSLYGKLRREPKRQGLSTLESIGLSLAALEGRPEINEQLLVPFKELLSRKRRG
ncbi:MAG: DTW domain-containing protein [Oligoflexia bacterium]|nr:DTW domain-containing protein [Oligoflexia bacterium]